MKQVIPAVIFVAAVTALAYLLGLTERFGAHPFWAEKVMFWGAPIGLILGLASMRIPYAVRCMAFGILVGVSAAVAYWGKTTFAASFAENAVAGQAWFFGWIAVCAAVAGTLASLVKRN